MRVHFLLGFGDSISSFANSLITVCRGFFVFDRPSLLAIDFRPYLLECILCLREIETSECPWMGMLVKVLQRPLDFDLIDQTCVFPDPCLRGQIGISAVSSDSL